MITNNGRIKLIGRPQTFSFYGDYHLHLMVDNANGYGSVQWGFRVANAFRKIAELMEDDKRMAIIQFCEIPEGCFAKLPDMPVKNQQNKSEEEPIPVSLNEQV